MLSHEKTLGSVQQADFPMATSWEAETFENIRYWSMLAKGLGTAASPRVGSSPPLQAACVAIE